ncbi:FKBP-type peptidyl-prolyl cis-trans isomerase [Buchnera aphidicola (Aphis craccivora)]|uniref:Peptidyl-prolyl cis-trans isomerase n=1 Tax=Buchnera aphidicola (Aphis craccivora) TaxID=466616 RepID=A0A4D6XNT2_9GAMM|nr:FKBP-type peptidyl-prolyl cis-trans isomerase [Buchnera aphidicola]QCI16754.1 FKBP-type peptidyl-prolyl cis-trans isomerase [Buchnera aphidicola (Aphis craccivora)]QLL40886.1 FKBP-type peptidyl-prolyl cis-trans isomerase [Buchnera aphidicola (Aphis craccivore)]WAI17728.1 MAG: FKBP-type peptidyl-prolyl cis-trans isomerase [Buchnera aphidicola (Aphis craccivora)]
MIFFLLKRIMFLLLLFYIPNSYSKTQLISQFQPSLETKKIFKNENEKIGYALGVSLGNYVNQSFEKQKKLGIQLDKNSLLLGIQDAISNNLQLSSQEISEILENLEKKLKNATKIQIKKDEKENLIQGQLYMEKFSQIKGARKTHSGLMYIIENPGKGEEITENTEITVHYKGSLINGVEFDNSYSRGKPVVFTLKDVILGWQEGLKYIKKGGKIKLVIPPSLGYGNTPLNGIPGSSTLIFDIELIDVKNN